MRPLTGGLSMNETTIHSLRLLFVVLVGLHLS